MRRILLSLRDSTGTGLSSHDRATGSPSRRLSLTENFGYGYWWNSVIQDDDDEYRIDTAVSEIDGHTAHFIMFCQTGDCAWLEDFEAKPRAGEPQEGARND